MQLDTSTPLILIDEGSDLESRVGPVPSVGELRI